VKKRSTLAQGTTEYGLILSLAVLAVLLAVTFFGQQLSASYQKGVTAVGGAPPPTSIQSITQDFISRMLIYHQSTGYWPPNGGYAALGLNPADWQAPVSGIQWNPNGEYIGLANASGDNLQVYVKDTNGNLLHLYDGWDIWCRATDGACFFHTAGSGTPVDLNTVVVTGN
jgi:Flp pilus assembly pilin Flp